MRGREGGKERWVALLLTSTQSLPRGKERLVGDGKR